MFSTDAVPIDSPSNPRSWTPVPHKELFVRIEEDLVEDERRSLKGLLYGRIPAGKLQKYTVGDMFRHLERMGQITPTNLEPIAVLMEAIHRNDWANRVRRLQEQSRAAASGTSGRSSSSRRGYRTDGPGRKRTRDVAASAGTSTHSQSRVGVDRPRAGGDNEERSSDDEEEEEEEDSGGSNGNDSEEPPVKRKAPAHPITDAHLAKLARKMKTGWRRVGMESFGVTLADIDRWRTKHPHDRDMQIVEMFKTWKDKTGRNATLRTLCEKLEEAGVEYGVYSFLTEEITE